jgi:hypothetical protein
MYVGRRTGSLGAEVVALVFFCWFEAGRGEDPCLREGIEDMGEDVAGVERLPMASLLGAMLLASLFLFQARGAEVAAACVAA